MTPKEGQRMTRREIVVGVVPRTGPATDGLTPMRASGAGGDQSAVRKGGKLCLRKKSVG